MELEWFIFDKTDSMANCLMIKHFWKFVSRCRKHSQRQKPEYRWRRRISLCQQPLGSSPSWWHCLPDHEWSNLKQKCFWKLYILKMNIPLSVCSLSGESWISSISTFPSLWCVSDTCNTQISMNYICISLSYPDLYLMIIVSKTQQSAHSSRKEVSEHFRRCWVSFLPCEGDTTNIEDNSNTNEGGRIAENILLEWAQQNFACYL